MNSIDSFLLICNSFVVKFMGMVLLFYILLFRLANYKEPCKRSTAPKTRARGITGYFLFTLNLFLKASLGPLLSYENEISFTCKLN